MATILVTGKDGQLGRCIQDCTQNSPDTYIFVGHNMFDLTSKENMSAYFDSAPNIDIVVNCAAYTNVNGADLTPDEAVAINSRGVRELGELCRDRGIKLIHISTDYVYNGDSGVNIEDDLHRIGPQNCYGASKYHGEMSLSDTESLDYMVIRTSWLYSEYGINFVKTIISKMKQGEPMYVVYDQVGCPTNAHDLANFIVEQVIRTYSEHDVFVTGTYNYSNEGAVSWYDFAMAVCELYGRTVMQDGDIIGYTIRPTETDPNSTTKRPSSSITSKKKVKHAFVDELFIPYWRDSLRGLIESKYKLL